LPEEEGTVEEPSYGDLIRKLDEACTFLRAFARGHRGFTQQDARAGVWRVNELCDRLENGFESRPGAADAVAMGRTHVVEAKAHLATLTE
jgi:hypothetical protein